MPTRILLVVLATASAALVVPTAAGAAVKGSYVCSVQVGSGRLPADSQLALTSTGRYSFLSYGVNGGRRPGGRYSRKSSRITFSGGVLDGKHAAMKTSPVFGQTLTFASLLGARHVCTKR